jgi:hypothetical protein
VRSPLEDPPEDPPEDELPALEPPELEPPELDPSDELPLLEPAERPVLLDPFFSPALERPRLVDAGAEAPSSRRV